MPFASGNASKNDIVLEVSLRIFVGILPAMILQKIQSIRLHQSFKILNHRLECNNG